MAGKWNILLGNKLFEMENEINNQQIQHVEKGLVELKIFAKVWDRKWILETNNEIEKKLITSMHEKN